jgi:hypothetical protein
VCRARHGTPEFQLPAKGGAITLVLSNAVALASDTDNRCEGMAFTTSWTVTAANA